MTQIELFREFAKERGLYIATMEDLPRLVDTAIDGYGNDYPLLQWFDQGGDGEHLREASINPKGWKETWRANILSNFPDSIIIADSSDINAWIMWLMPHFHQYSNMEWLMNGGVKAFLHLGVGPIMRFDSFERYCVGQRQKLAPDSFYLYNIVVRRNQQHKGLGRKLLDVSHTFIDNVGGSAYLETHKPKNVPIYQSFGYELLSDEPIPNTRLKHFAMKRK